LRRCLQPICDEFRDGVTTTDVAIYLEGEGFPRNAELKQVAAEIQPLIAVRYNLTTLATAMRSARKKSLKKEEPLTLGLVTDALQSLCSTAAGRRAQLEMLAEKSRGGGK